jgi:hypothetical protein
MTDEQEDSGCGFVLFVISVLVFGIAVTFWISLWPTVGPKVAR